MGRVMLIDSVTCGCNYIDLRWGALLQGIVSATARRKQCTSDVQKCGVQVSAKLHK